MRMKVSDWEVVEHELEGPAAEDWKFGVLKDHIEERTRGKRNDAIMAIGVPTPLLRTVLQIIAKNELPQYKRETSVDPETGERSSRNVPFQIEIPVDE